MTRVRPFKALFLGAPGAGKGTQVSRLVKDYPSIGALSSGDVLRQNVTQKTPLGSKVRNIMKNGGLVPDDIMVDLIIGQLRNHQWLHEGSSWILDGFPRTINQAPPLDKTLKDHGVPIDTVIRLKVPEEVILERIENRWIHLPSGRVYNLTFNPPKTPGKDDITGEPLSKRDDDNPAVFKQRLDKYHDMTMPLVDYYDKQGILYEFEGETSDIIYPKLKRFFENRK